MSKNYSDLTLITQKRKEKKNDYNVRLKVNRN